MRPEKFKTRIISPSNPDQLTFIIGQDPPKRQRKGNQTGEVFHGTRSGDFIESIIKGKENIYLTNICNYTEFTKENIRRGLIELQSDIDRIKPKKIILLGKHAEDNFKKSIRIGNIPVIVFPHPSYVLRFNLNPQNYFEMFRREL